MQDHRTRITFRFTRPVAINLPSFPEVGLMLGNFYPVYEKYEKKVGDLEVPLGVYDLSKETELVLLNELPEPLPQYLLGQADEDTIKAYKVDQVKTATQNNAICDQIRRYLEHYQREGHIVIVKDTFRDTPAPAATEKVEKAANSSRKKPVRRTKTKT